MYGTDYYSPSDTNSEIVAFATGETTATSIYTLSMDAIIEDMETFTLSLTLSGTTDENQLAMVTSPNVVTVTIVDCTCELLTYSRNDFCSASSFYSIKNTLKQHCT